MTGFETLTDLFGIYNARHFGGRLAPYTVRVEDLSGKDHDALSNHRLRTIVIDSDPALIGGPVIGLLLHEMVHVYLDSLGVREVEQHGPLFQRVITRLVAAGENSLRLIEHE